MVQWLFSQVLQLLRGKDSSSDLMTSGSSLPPTTGGRGKGKRVSFLCLYHHMVDEGGMASYPTVTNLGPTHLYFHQLGQLYCVVHVRYRMGWFLHRLSRVIIKFPEFIIVMAVNHTESGIEKQP